MRKQDRDRDRVLHPKQIEDFTEKYNIGIQGVLPELQTRFEDSKFKGMTNYEDMLTYFIAFKETTIIEDNDPKINNVKPNPEAVFAETKSFKPKSNHSMNKSGQNSATIFEDRGEAKLVSSYLIIIQNEHMYVCIYQKFHFKRSCNFAYLANKCS